MTSFAKQLNRKRHRDFDINTEGFNYVKLVDLYNENGADKVYTVLGCYQHNGQFGLESVLIIDGKFVNLPKHLNDDVKAIMDNMEVIDNRQLGFKVIPYTSKFGQFFTIEWIDL